MTNHYDRVSNLQGEFSSSHETECNRSLKKISWVAAAPPR